MEEEEVGKRKRGGEERRGEERKEKGKGKSRGNEEDGIEVESIIPSIIRS